MTHQGIFAIDGLGPAESIGSKRLSIERKRARSRQRRSSAGRYRIIQRVVAQKWRAATDDDEHFVYAIAL